MGPPEFTGGNHEIVVQTIVDLDPASMGPPEFTGGNLRQAREAYRAFRQLQWGRRNSPAETLAEWILSTQRAYASMGPPEFTGGNLLASAMP